MEIKETYDELDLTVIYKLGIVSMEFDSYEIIGHQGKNFKEPLYELKGWKQSGDDTTELKEARTLIRGFVKWDGCSHFYFGDEGGYVHVCGGNNPRQLADAIVKIYNRCGELMIENNINLLEGEFPAKV